MPASQGPPPTPSGRRLARHLTHCEWVIAIALAAFLLWIHLQNLVHASMLWRDELTTLHASTRPSIAEVWALTEWESVPLLWPMVLRCWTGLGLGADAASLRTLALVVGVAILASLFVASWRIAGALPLLSLLLVAANPTVIRYGDTLRAYGLGLLLVVLLVVVFWELTLRATRGRVVGAALLSILGVQCLYHDAVVVLALCTACAAAWASRGRVREAMIPLAIGAFAAITLLPYTAPLLRAQEWNVVFRSAVDLAWLSGRLWQSVQIDGPWLGFVWAGLAIAALTVCVYRLFRPAPSQESPTEQRARAVFFAVTLCVGIGGYATFLILVGYPTQSWYYLSLLGLAGVVIESSLVLQTGAGLGFRVVRLGIVVASLALVAPGISEGFPLRTTNLDRVAAVLQDQARADDLILVSPWYLGISFEHYYAGPTPWLSVPEIADHELTRYDLVKEVMMRPEGVEPIADRVQETLARRGRVWLVGVLPLVAGNPPPPVAPIAPDSPLGWSEHEYQQLWSRTVAYRLQKYASQRSRVPIDGIGRVDRFENPPLYLFEATR